MNIQASSGVSCNCIGQSDPGCCVNRARQAQRNATTTVTLPPIKTWRDNDWPFINPSVSFPASWGIEPEQAEHDGREC